MEKHKTPIKKEISLLRETQWKFITRNEDYKKDYMQYKKEYKDFKKKYGKIPEIWKFERQEYFIERWGINIDKAINYRKTPKSLPIYEKPIAELCVQEVKPSPDYTNHFENDAIPQYEGYEYRIPPHRCRNEGWLIEGKYKSFDWNIAIKVDLDYPKKRIMHELERVLDEAIEARDKEIKNGEIRKWFNNYEQYIKVYDLRENDISWEKIANKVYANDDADAIRKVHRDYARCKKLIKEVDKYLVYKYLESGKTEEITINNQIR